MGRLVWHLLCTEEDCLMNKIDIILIIFSCIFLTAIFVYSTSDQDRKDCIHKNGVQVQAADGRSICIKRESVL
jgi:hypothetical protein